jgi:hypothetical protein
MVDWFSVAVWSLAGTWALVVGTLALMYWQTRSAQHLNSANAVMALRERFDGARMLAARRHLADRLIEKKLGDIASMEVVTFFELVGTLTHRGVLERELVWEAFGSWATAYYWGLRHPDDLIGRLREELRDPLVFHDYEWLCSEMERIDRERLGDAAQVADSDAMSRKFLEREQKLNQI